MLILATWMFVFYYTEALGYNNERRGILFTASIVYPEVPCACLYFYSWCAGTELTAVLMWLFKVHFMNMCIAIACMCIDAALFFFAHDVFCKMQLEKHSSDCAARNKYYWVVILVFFFVFVPIWYASANAMRRYANELKRPLKHGELRPLRGERHLSKIDSAYMEEIKEE